MIAEHALDSSGDGELFHADDEILAGWLERRPWNGLLLALGHNGFPFVVAALLLDLRDFGVRRSAMSLFENTRSI